MKIQFNLENRGEHSGLGGSALLKLTLISVLTLVLLIPSKWIENIITERQERQSEVIKDISNTWAGSQLLEGPVLVIPYKTINSERDSLGIVHTGQSISNIYILPENLEMKGKLFPLILHRGIFNDVVYHSKIQVSGTFSKMEMKRSGIIPAGILWEKAKMDIGLSDLKGVSKSLEIHLDNQSYPAEPDPSLSDLFANNLIINADLSDKKQSDLNFSFTVELKGSEELNFLQVGKNTQVHIEGDWGNPSFIGSYLPETRKVEKNHFMAAWQMPFFNRPFPQQWIGKNTLFENKEGKGIFGVKLALPIDQYQENMRSAKYAILVILLGFLSLFFTELLKKTQIHLLNYVLIGFSLIIFYLLLISLSEQFGFNLAYLIASFSTILLIGTFVSTLIRNRMVGILFSGILSVFYGFIFIIIQLQDFALLVGSLGLFLIMALLMYFSTRLNLHTPVKLNPDGSNP